MLKVFIPTICFRFDIQQHVSSVHERLHQNVVAKQVTDQSWQLSLLKNGVAQSRFNEAG